MGDSDAEALDGAHSIHFATSGELLLADAGAKEIRVFDRAGHQLTSWGGPGEGPGEFVELTRARLAADTVVAYDRELSRVTWFTLDGRTIRDQRISPPRLWFPEFLGTFRGGIVFSAHGILTRAAPPPRRFGAYRDTLHVIRIAGTGEDYQVIATTPGQEHFGVEITAPNGARMHGLSLHDFQRRAFAAADGTQLVFGATDRPELMIEDDRGRVALTWRDRSEQFSDENLHVLPEHTRAASQGESTARALAILEQVPKPDTLPAFDRLLLLAADGSVWVRAWAWPNVNERVWLVLDLDANEMVRVRIPADYQVEAVAADRIAVLHRDSLGVETVAVYRLMPQ